MTGGKVLVPVLGAAATGGFVSRLVLEEIDPVKRELVAHPDAALQFFGNELLATLQREWEQRSKQSVRWALTMPGKPEMMPLDGDSLGAAAAVGFVLLGEHRPYDSGCAITAAVEKGKLHKVGDEKRKLEAALASGLKRAGVAADTHLTQTEIDDLRSRGLEVQKLRTLAQAVEFASGLATGLREYYRVLLELPDREADRPAYLGNRKPTELYLWPDVLKRERKMRWETMPRRGGEPDPEKAMRREERHRTPLPPEALEIGEDALYGQRDDETERRVAWRDEMADLKRGMRRAAVVLGPPGAGKSELVKMTTCEHARQGNQDLMSQATGLDETLLPIALSFRDLVQDHPRTDQTPEERLRYALGAKLRGMWEAREVEETVKHAVVEYIVRHAHEERAWLFLDALDELAREDQRQMTEHFGVLSAWRCRLVMTSRPYGYEGWRLPFEVEEYRLAPLSEEQSFELVRKWYGGDKPTGAN